MAGFPQVRESGWLYRTGEAVPLAFVRLEEQPDGGGWDLYVHDPASAPSQHAHFDDEEQARKVLERLYDQGRADGEWKVYRKGQPG